LVKLVAAHQRHDADKVFKSVSAFLFEAFDKEIEAQVRLRVSAEVQDAFATATTNGRNAEEIQASITALADTLDLSSLWRRWNERCRRVIDDADYRGLLRYYQRKSIARRIAPCFGLEEGEYHSLVLRLLRSDQRDAILAAIRSCLPEFPPVASAEANSCDCAEQGRCPALDGSDPEGDSPPSKGPSTPQLRGRLV
jgi:hypothetical protein